MKNQVTLKDSEENVHPETFVVTVFIGIFALDHELVSGSFTSTLFDSLISDSSINIVPFKLISHIPPTAHNFPA